jgi:hypothetical protein
MFGTFNVTSSLRSVTYRNGSSLAPLATAGVPARLADIATLPLQPGAVTGSENEWEARWYSTLADSLDNNLRVNLGLGVPSARIIEDRAANGRAEMQSSGRIIVAAATYDPRKDPARVSFRLDPAAAAPAAPAWERKELFVLNRDWASGEDGGRPAFCASETVQAIDIAPQSVRGTRSGGGMGRSGVAKSGRGGGREGRRGRRERGRGTSSLTPFSLLQRRGLPYRPASSLVSLARQRRCGERRHSGAAARRHGGVGVWRCWAAAWSG